MDTALPQKFPFILDRNLAKANCTENHVCTSCDTLVLDFELCHSCCKRAISSHLLIALERGDDNIFARVWLFKGLRAFSSRSQNKEIPSSEKTKTNLLMWLKILNVLRELYTRTYIGLMRFWSFKHILKDRTLFNYITSAFASIKIESYNKK